MKHLFQLLCMVAVMLVVVAGPAAADDSQKGALSPEETPVSANVTMGEIQVLFKSLADQADLKLQSDLGIQGKISFRTTEKKLSDTMDMICKPFKCVWQVKDGALVIDIKK